MARKKQFITIYNSKGEPEEHTRANCVDLTRHSGYTWNPQQVLSPVDPAPIPKEKDDPVHLGTGEDPNKVEPSTFDRLKEKAVKLNVSFAPNIGEETLRERVKAKEAEIAAEKEGEDDSADEGEEPEDE